MLWNSYYLWIWFLLQISEWQRVSAMSHRWKVSLVVNRASWCSFYFYPPLKISIKYALWRINYEYLFLSFVSTFKLTFLVILFWRYTEIIADHFCLFFIYSFTLLNSLTWKQFICSSTPTIEMKLTSTNTLNKKVPDKTKSKK